MSFSFGMWDLKERHQSADWCKKVSGGHFFSPWESPLFPGAVRRTVNGNEEWLQK